MLLFRCNFIKWILLLFCQSKHSYDNDYRFESFLHLCAILFCAFHRCYRWHERKKANSDSSKAIFFLFLRAKQCTKRERNVNISWESALCAAFVGFSFFNSLCLRLFLFQFHFIVFFAIYISVRIHIHCNCDCSVMIVNVHVMQCNENGTLKFQQSRI